MNKESKIGLLVGLGFILVVGILLSDHLSATNEPPSAPLQMAGYAVRSSMDATSANTATAPGVVRVPRTITPPASLATAGELAARARAAAAELPAAAMAVEPVTDPVPVTPPSANPGLIATAERAGHPVVASDLHGGGRTVTAERGDNVGTLAERAYGANTRSTREALLESNPGLKADPGRIVAGRAYAVDGPSAGPSATAACGTVVYVVQPHDTLRSIAAAQLGSTRAVPAIRELNADVLRDGDRVYPRMKLRLPK